MEPSIRWESHPIREHPREAVGVVLIIGFAIYGVYTFTGDVLLSAAGLLFLLISLRSFFLVTEYGLDAEGVSLRRGGRNSRIPWSEYEEALAVRRGVHLSAARKTGFLDGYRGTFLRLSPGPPGQGQVVEFATRQIRKASADCDDLDGANSVPGTPARGSSAATADPARSGEEDGS